MPKRQFENKTRDGKKVRIYAQDGSKPFVIHGAILKSTGWEERSWTKEGWYSEMGKQHENDLIPKRENLIIGDIVECNCRVEFVDGTKQSSW